MEADKSGPCLRHGVGGVTRHPRKGAVEQPAVAEGEPVENEAAKWSMNGFRLRVYRTRQTGTTSLWVKCTHWSSKYLHTIMAGGPDFDLAGTRNKRVPRPLRFLQRAGVGNVDILEHGVAAQGDK